MDRKKVGLAAVWVVGAAIAVTACILGGPWIWAAVAIAVCFAWRWPVFAWIDEWLTKRPVVDVVDKLSKLAIVVFAGIWIYEAPRRARLTEIGEIKAVEGELRTRARGKLIEDLVTRDVDLGGARLVGANLGSTSLVNAWLSYADLSEAILLDANLLDSHLLSASLRRANLWRANLRGANLMCADLSGANLLEADLSGADLRFADLTMAAAYGASLAGANLEHANLSGANLWHANLSEANLSSADLASADFTGANLTGAYLASAESMDLLGAQWEPESPPDLGDILVATDLQVVEGRELVVVVAR